MLLQRVTSRWEGGKAEDSEWTCEGSLKLPEVRVDADGSLIRYQQGIYDSI